MLKGGFTEWLPDPLSSAARAQLGPHGVSDRLSVATGMN